MLVLILGDMTTTFLAEHGGMRCAGSSFPTNFVSEQDGLDDLWTYQKDTVLMKIVLVILSLLAPLICCSGPSSGLLLSKGQEMSFLARGSVRL